MKIKHTFLILIIVFTFTSNVSAQGMPVYDNTNFVSLVKSLVESAKQTSQLIQTVKFLKDQKENIEKVNAVIQQLKAVKELAKNNERLYNVVRTDLRDILNSKYIRPDEVNRISDTFNAIMETAIEDLDFIDQILSSNFLKMTDADRSKILKDKETESNNMVSEINNKTKRYREIISFREMQDLINNRAKNY
ncbi:conjugative transposon protein TraI [Formosa agariphila KMM 3901]|uniref:Conjugative transposon protein TraI n=1 Tax=Formosa agariphila (strain DSM 15362 / KCTC 12365 / LMG 23005 / KMM 3901 / M-2Alg 35-1) TaxID=1347342 RepID=T2KPB1_FORAG|nr:conjugal transfer protein [Formosa agariphila]CDF80298.1 conjugative transposon protein TraI [Formosa agariphila KMM 3901]